MNKHAERINGLVTARDGFVLPVVIFALVIMSTVAVVVLRTSVDEQFNGRAVRQSAGSFYAAEAGVSAARIAWADTTASLGAQVKAMAPGDSVVVGDGWQKLTNGAAYRATIMRLDTSGQQLYMLSVEGRDRNTQGGESVVHLVLTPGTGGGTLTLGECCEAAVKMKGTLDIQHDNSLIDGKDKSPPGWDAAGSCNGIPKQDVPGVIHQNPADITGKWPSQPTIQGVPAPVVPDPTITEGSFENYGGLTFDQLKAKANHILGSYGVSKTVNWGGDPKSDMSKYGPSVSGGACNKADPLNFGSNNPTSPCFDYWPIILVRGKTVRIAGSAGSYSQGIFILDQDPVTLKGTNLELEGGVNTFAGIIIGFGCLENVGHKFYGAVLISGTRNGVNLCTGDPPVSTDAGLYQYSSCVVQRALKGTGLGQGSGSSGMVKIGRAFELVLR